jgi:hypothetical protein
MSEPWPVGELLDVSRLLWHDSFMDSDEREIFNYLKSWNGEFLGVAEICRRSGSKKRYHEDPDWAKPILHLMLERGIVERDIQGRYRIKPKPKKKNAGRWISPDIEQVLKEKGVEVESQNLELEDDEHYEQL